MLDDVNVISTLLATHRPAQRNQGYPVAVRRRVGAWARGQRDAGRSWAGIGRGLPVSTATLKAWARLSGTDDQLVPVVVDTPRTSAAAAVGPTPVLVSPAGFRVEGLDLDTLLLALERLG